MPADGVGVSSSRAAADAFALSISSKPKACDASGRRSEEQRVGVSRGRSVTGFLLVLGDEQD